VTERKPAGVSFESWVERQLREARERGSFEGLAGTGKPLPRTAADELAWVREKAKREDLPVAALLPPALAVAKEVEDLPERLARERSEARVRALVSDLNRRIDAVRRGPQIGPPVRTALLDEQAVVAAWRASRPAPPVAPAAAPAEQRSGLRRVLRRRRQPRP
jgi:hypothetical protein